MIEKAMQNKIRKDNFRFDTKTYKVSEKEKIVSWMKSRDTIAAAASSVFDVVIGDTITGLGLTYKEDGNFRFSTQDIYHIEKYDAAITDAYYTHLKENGII